jgi:hypothetical protein
MAKRKRAAEQPAEQNLAEEMLPQEAEGSDLPPDQPDQETSRQEQRRIPDPFPIITDSQAGVRLLESRHYRQMQIKFDVRPSQPVLDKVAEAGYSWKNKDKVWTKQLEEGTAMQDRIDAERLFAEVRDILRADKGIAQTR